MESSGVRFSLGSPRVEVAVSVNTISMPLFHDFIQPAILNRGSITFQKARLSITQPVGRRRHNKGGRAEFTSFDAVETPPSNVCRIEWMHCVVYFYHGRYLWGVLKCMCILRVHHLLRP